MEEGVVRTPKQPVVSDVRLPQTEISLDILPLQSFLGVDAGDTKTIEQLHYIKSQFGNDVGISEVLHQLRQIELKLGAPRLGETRAGKIYNYLRADAMVKNAEKIRNAYLS